MNWRRSIFVGGCLAALGTLANAGDPQFVTVKGTHFYLHDRPYYFAGTNLWYGAYLGAPAPIGDRERLGKELDALKALGVTNLRVLAMSEASDLKRAVRPAIMTKPGQFDEALLTGLDYLLAEMAKRDMKAVLYLNNFWQWSGGMAQYVSWFTGKPAVDPDVAGDWNGFMDYSAEFYRLERAQELYRDVIGTLVNRKNSVTGKSYRDDPTIMSWQLANEPRPGSDQNGQRNSEAWIRWIDDTSKYIQQIAPITSSAPATKERWDQRAVTSCS